MSAFLKFLSDYQVLIAAMIPLLFTLIRMTKWGKANQETLIKVAEAIESVGDSQLKAEIAAKLETAPQGQKDVMDHVVSVVDPFKTPMPVFERIVLDLSRAMLLKGKGGR